jgi:hypothetical protein
MGFAVALVWMLAATVRNVVWTLMASALERDA